MPRGAPAELRFDGPKVSDPDNDQVDITHTFRKPGDSRETTPGEMLLEHRTEEFNELFHSATGVDIAAFTETYRAGTGETVLTGTITVSDGVAQAELAFTLSVRFDPSPQYAGPASHLNGQRWKIPQVCVVPEGAQTSPAATVAWTSLTTTAFTWAAGTESTPQVACGAAQDDWPSATAVDSGHFQASGHSGTPGRNAPHVQRPAGLRKPGGPEPGQRVPSQDLRHPPGRRMHRVRRRRGRTGEGHCRPPKRCGNP